MTICSPGKPCNHKVHLFNFSRTKPISREDKTFCLIKTHLDGSLCLTARLQLNK